jgi:TM2 domain-containing membrane protein YozV
MSNALVRRSGSGGSGIVPAVASAIVPGVGQLINGQGAKALGVFAVWLIAGASLIGWIPIIGTLAALVATGTWVYGVADAYVVGRKK